MSGGLTSVWTLDLTDGIGICGGQGWIGRPGSFALRCQGAAALVHVAMMISLVDKGAYEVITASGNVSPLIFSMDWTRLLNLVT